jgi:hypothetical protein
MTDDPGPSVRTAKSQQRVPSSCVVAYGRQRTGGRLVQGDPRVVGRVWRAEGPLCTVARAPRRCATTWRLGGTLS